MHAKASPLYRERRVIIVLLMGVIAVAALYASSSSVQHGVGDHASTDLRFPTPNRCDAIAPEESLADCTHEADYIARWATMRAGHNWTIVDVGANKGYNIADILSAVGFPGYNRQILARHLIDYAKSINMPAQARRNLCGTCFGCMGESPTPKQDHVFLHYAGSRPTDFRVYGVDPIASHVEALRKAFNDTNRFTFALGIGSDTPGTSNFIQFSFGEEAGSVYMTNQNYKRLKVAHIVLDTWLHNVPFVDVLLTDTESHDLIVAEGAKNLLFDGRVGLYIFEMGNAKRIDTFESFLARLDASGYNCYAAIGSGPKHRSLARINGPNCWRERYMKIPFMNVMCGNRKFPDLVDELDHWTTNFKPITRYNEESMRAAKPDWDLDWLVGKT
jgi:hypothetical protein